MAGMVRWAALGLRLDRGGLSGVVLTGTPSNPTVTAVERRHLSEAEGLLAALCAAAVSAGYTLARAGLVLDGCTSQERIALAGLCAARGFPMSGLRLVDLSDLADRHLGGAGANAISEVTALSAAVDLTPYALTEQEALLAALAALDIALQETSRGILPESVVRAYGPLDEGDR